MTMFRKLGFIVTATLISFSAQAGEIPAVTYCDSLMTLQDLDDAFVDPEEVGVSEGIEHCVQGDKSYENWGYTLDPETEIDFPDPTAGVHTFRQKNLTKSGELAYAIEVDTSSPNYISRVILSMTVLEGDDFEYGIIKHLFTPKTGCDFQDENLFCFNEIGTLNVFWNKADEQVSDYIDVAVTKLFVLEEFFIYGEGAEIEYSVNQFGQTPVPAPIPLALFGTGLLGLVAARRRKAA